MPLQTPAYCRTRAEECERLAATATSAETREIMTYLAQRWRMLAEGGTRKTPVKLQHSTPLLSA
jgi:hypothetical protein